MAHVRARQGGSGSQSFQVARFPRDGSSRRPRLLTLQLVSGSGDDEHVVTICLPGEE